MSRLSTNYDRIITSAPLDRQAAIVGAADGEGGEQDIAATTVGGRFQWDAPQPLAPMPSSLQDLTGLKVGRLTVIGYLGKGNATGAASQRWLVRCSCSAYESRRAKPLLAPQVEDMCGRCAYRQKGLDILAATRTGKWPDGRPANVPPGLNTASGVRRLKEGAA